MRLDVPVVVVGAGVSGLVTAYELGKHGIDSLVLEREARAGGRLHTVTFADGATAEAGMEEFWHGNPGFGLLGELDLPIREDVAHSSVVLEGRLSAYQGAGGRDDYLAGVFDPAGRTDFLAFNARVSELLAELAGPMPGGAGLERLSLARTGFDRFVRETVSSPRVAEWVRVVVESETAVTWDRISALDGIAELRPFVDTPAGFGETNAHVVGGNGRVIDALVARLPAGAVRTAQAVTRVRDVGSHVEIHHSGRGTASRITRCDQVVVTAPAWSLRRIEIDPPPHGPAAVALARAEAGSYVKVVLRLRPEAAESWNRHGPGLFTLLTDSQAGCVYLTPAGHGCDDGGAQDHVLTMLVHAGHALRLTGRPEHEIAERAVGHLASLSAATRPGGRAETLFPGLARHVTHAAVFDHPRAVAYWPHHSIRSRFDALSAALRAPHGRVHFAGDTTESSHSDGAFASAYRVAATAAARLTDVPVLPRLR